MATLLAFGFSDGFTANAGVGHQIDLGSGLSAGQVEQLGVICDASVTTPAGWTAAPSDTSAAGTYTFRRTTGASGLVSILTAADRPCAIIHVRLSAVSTVDQAMKAVANASAATSTPTATSSALAASGETVVAFGLVHNYTAAPVGPVSWSGGLTAHTTTLGPIATATDGTAGHSVAAMVGISLNTGPTPTTATAAASWSTNTASDRVTNLITWQGTVPGGITIVDYATTDDGVLSGQLPPITAAMAGDAVASGALAGVLPAVTASIAGDAQADGVLTGALVITATFAGDAIADGVLAGQLPPIAGSFSDQIAIEPGTLTAGGISPTLTASGILASTLIASGRP